MILAQQDYSAVWTIDPKTKQVRQYYPNLPAIDRDKSKAYEMCQFLKIKDFGPNDQNILNKDLEVDSVTEKEVNWVFQAIVKEHRKNPDTRQLNMFFFACHGIDKNSI